MSEGRKSKFRSRETWAFRRDFKKQMAFKAIPRILVDQDAQCKDIELLSPTFWSLPCMDSLRTRKVKAWVGRQGQFSWLAERKQDSKDGSEETPGSYKWSLSTQLIAENKEIVGRVSGKANASSRTVTMSSFYRNTKYVEWQVRESVILVVLCMPP